MKYLMAIYLNEQTAAGLPPSGANAGMSKEYAAFNASLKQSGALLGGEALQPTSTATTVRIRDGKRLVTDGPFAETREALAGFYLVEARDIDEAVAIASRIPGARTGCVEVRPCVVFAPGA